MLAHTKPMEMLNPEAPESALQDIGLHEQITAISDTTANSFYAIDKLEAHVKNVRHVAVSIFIFHEDRLLLQRRAKTKYHSAGLWANTVCSHPRWNETTDACAQRRLYEELGWRVPLKKFGMIDYAATVGDLFENEHVHCFHGSHNVEHDVNGFNPLEVNAVEWRTIPEILKQIKHYPQHYTEWFKIYMFEHRKMIDTLINKEYSVGSA